MCYLYIPIFYIPDISSEGMNLWKISGAVKKRVMCLVREKIDAKEYLGEKLQKSIFERFLFVLRDELSLSKPLVNWINKYEKL